MHVTPEVLAQAAQRVRKMPALGSILITVAGGSVLFRATKDGRWMSENTDIIVDPTETKTVKENTQ